ncbi:MAG: thioredoxin [archaeon]|jgi:putative thioredoxin|nr:thioredoxin [archaeon]
MEVNVNDSNFEKEVIEKSNEIPVLVDFWAGWCMPCLMLKPILEKIAKEYDGKFVLAKLNTDENPATSSKYGISSIPDVRIFKNGEVAGGFVGALPEESVKQWLDKNI